MSAYPAACASKADRAGKGTGLGLPAVLAGFGVVHGGGLAGTAAWKSNAVVGLMWPHVGR